MPGLVGTVTAAAVTERALRDVCRSVVADPRFAERGLVSGGGAWISYRADKVLVARLAELTGSFPVNADLLARARMICLELAATERTVTVSRARRNGLAGDRA